MINDFAHRNYEKDPKILLQWIKRKYNMDNMIIERIPIKYIHEIATYDAYNTYVYGDSNMTLDAEFNKIKVCLQKHLRKKKINKAIIKRKNKAVIKRKTIRKYV